MSTGDLKGGKVYRWHREQDRLAVKTPLAPETVRAPQPPTAPEAGARIEPPPRHWFCASRMPAGTITRKESESLTDVLEVAKGAELSWIDFWTDNLERDLPVIAAELGFTGRLASSLSGEYSVTYQDFDTELGMRLPSIQIAGFDVKVDPLFLFIRSNMVISIHPLSNDRRFSRLRRYADAVLKRIPQGTQLEDKLTVLAMRIIDENNERNFEELRKIEERGDELSQNLTNTETPRVQLGIEIYEMKHALIVYLNALWETVDVLHALRYGDAELITSDPSLLNKMTVLTDDVNRQIALSEHMSDVLASGMEVLQSIYNNQLQVLNNRMSMVIVYLTIVGTAVLVPNTIATIMSNAAFDMSPRDLGWYVGLLVATTIGATAAAYWWVKKKGWLPPKKME